MKKFIAIVLLLIMLVMALDTAYYRLGLFIDFHPDAPVTTFVRTEGQQILLQGRDGYEPLEIKGVNMGTGIPGEWSTDFAIDYDTFMRWFAQIQALGANTIRVYTVQDDVFYNAFYDYNLNNPNPLWLMHGVWVNDYVQNSHRDAYDKDFFDAFLDNCKTMVDVIHGCKKITLGRMASAGSGTYKRDISPWVIGYILGVEWEDLTVAYTDHKYQSREAYCSYQGEYMYTTGDASPFETMLARVGDSVIAYESTRYKQQRLVAFSNWPVTDPFRYPEEIEDFFMKCAQVDVEHIQTTERFLSGHFASYHVYPYYSDYLFYIDDWSCMGITDMTPFITSSGQRNSYRAYLSMLTSHHTVPVVISEFGVSTGRGMAQRDQGTGRNQGNMAEHEQGQALIDCYEDIRAVGCAGGCVFTWQDEWFKRTWNTMYAVNLRRTPYWSDYQTNEQYFGLLSFDPGKEQSVCYVDGDVAEWTEDDLVWQGDGSSLSMKYDEKFVYFLIYQKGLDFGSQTLYLPIDTTPKTGSSYCEGAGLRFDRPVDFLVVIHGEKDSRLLVQQRYDALRSTYSENAWQFNTYLKENIPDANTPVFVPVYMILQTATPLLLHDVTAPAEIFETGVLTYGNANPASADFNSLADFMCSGDYIELKLPWQLLNFSDPSRMEIHDDYYDGNYGVEVIYIDRLYAGLATAGAPERIALAPFALKGWGNKVTYHERLKSSYTMLQSYWRNDP